jgi:hypothetical protein
MRFPSPKFDPPLGIPSFSKMVAVNVLFKLCNAVSVDMDIPGDIEIAAAVEADGFIEILLDPGSSKHIFSLWNSCSNRTFT